MREEVDVVVVGGGVMGTSAALHLARRGASTVLLERFRIGHGNGSSGGPTRIFRMIYHHPDYVRMARLALDAWLELGSLAGERLLVPTGGIEIGANVESRADATAQGGASLERWQPEDVARRWPSINVPAGVPIVFDPAGAVCLASATVLAQARLSREAGVDIREQVEVIALRAEGGGVEVVTADGASLRSRVAIVTAGPWASALLGTSGIELPTRVLQEQVSYFRLGSDQTLPTFVEWSREPGDPNPMYAVPDPSRPGEFKVGRHASGPTVRAEDGPFEADPVRTEQVHSYARERFPSSSPTGTTETCLYTNTSDEDFVLDRVGPIVIGSPCSGHGFKFAPLIGGILADLATGREPAIPLHRFAAARLD